MKTIFKNVLKAVGVICYFLILLYATTKMDIGRLEEDIKIFAGAYLVIGILVLERAYKKDSGIYAITGVELLVLSLHSLSIMHMVNLFKYELNKYLLVSAIIISIYYVIKGIVLYTKEKKDYLKGLSDIPDIVKKDEPVKKEAKKREKQNSEVKSQENSDKSKQKTPKETEMTKKSTTKKSTTKKTTAKKSTAKKATTEKSETKKPSTKKSTTKKDTAEKSTTKKTTEKKSTTNKSTKKTETKATSTKKAATKETPTKKATTKATSAKKTKKEEVKEND